MKEKQVNITAGCNECGIDKFSKYYKKRHEMTNKHELNHRQYYENLVLQLKNDDKFKRAFEEPKEEYNTWIHPYGLKLSYD